MRNEMTIDQIELAISSIDQIAEHIILEEKSDDMKSIVKNVTWDVALQSHKCKRNLKHIIAKVDGLGLKGT